MSAIKVPNKWKIKYFIWFQEEKQNVKTWIRFIVSNNSYYFYLNFETSIDSLVESGKPADLHSLWTNDQIKRNCLIQTNQARNIAWVF